MSKYHKYGITARDAIEDALAVVHLSYDPNNARKGLNDLISWHVCIALDPAVSSDAQKLIDIGRAQVLAELFE